MNVLVVAAHPDDEILGVGGTVCLHARRGDRVRSLIACEGISMRYDMSHRETLQRQIRQAGDILGVERVVLAELPEQRLDTLPLVDVAAVVEAQVRDFRPEIVYTHFGGDVNQDHQVLFRAVLVATRPYAAPSVREVLAFETPSSSEWGAPLVTGSFLPQVFVDISQVLEEKIRAFCCYEREVREAPHPRSPEALRARAYTWGSVVGCTAAEPFQVVRILR